MAYAASCSLRDANQIEGYNVLGLAALASAWLLVYTIIFYGAKSISLVTYVNALIMILLIVTFLIGSVLLENSFEGISSFFAHSNTTIYSSIGSN